MRPARAELLDAPVCGREFEMRDILFGMTAFITLLLCSAASASGKYDSRFLVGGDGYRLDRDDAVVILYTHGSGGDDKRDPCRFTIGRHFLDQYFGSFRMPRVLEELADRDRRIALFYVCHRETGDNNALKAESHKRTPCGGPSRSGRAKFCKRVDRIATELANIRRANPGLPASRIFLSGVSSGAWTSMLLARRQPGIVAGVIAFAPAANGKLGRQIIAAKGKTQRKSRKCGTDAPVGQTIPKVPSASRYFRHQCQQDYIAEKIRSALVFSFEGDPYNPPELLPLFRKARHRIEFHAVSRPRCGPSLPFSSHPHACYQTRAFNEDHFQTVRDYLDRRLAR